jgi:tetratricopeptide (TPR) repeat protein
VEWLDRLERENDNLRAALSWALDRRAGETAARLAAALRQFWEVRGLTEGRAWLDAVLVASEGHDLPARVKVLDGAGWISMWRGELDRALSRFEEAAALCRRIEDRESLGSSLHGIGSVLGAKGDTPGAVRVLEESVAAARDVGDARTLGYSLGALASNVTVLGDQERARELAEECLAILRSLGDRVGIARTLNALAVGALDRREYGRVEPAAAEMLVAFRDLGYSMGIAYSLELLASSAAAQAQAERAVRLWAAADALREAIAAPRLPYSLRFEPYIASAHAQLDEESCEHAQAEGREMTVEQAIEYALSADEPSEPQ